MGSQALWQDVIDGALTQATGWITQLSPVLTAFVALGIIGLAIMLVRRATS